MRRGVRLVGIKVVVKPNGRRYVYRRVGGQLFPLPDLPENDDEFIAAYQDAAVKAKAPKKIRTDDGTVEWLATRYLASSAFRELAKGTRDVRSRILKHIVKDRGSARVAGLRDRHIQADLGNMAPVPANSRLKVWRALLAYGVDCDAVTQNAAAGVKPRKTKSTPHRPWGIEQIQAFRAHFPIGTAPRTAFEVFWWTGARCSDVRRLGPSMVDGHGWLNFTQQKTGGSVSIPWSGGLPGLWAAFERDHALLLESVAASKTNTFIATQTGSARSEKALSQWFAGKARDALKSSEFTAHGLRKSRAIAIIEIGGTPHQVGAWTGHDSLKEIADYTRDANRRRLLGFQPS